MKQMVRYGIGEQDFKSLIERNCVYVDKTQYIDKLVNSGSKYYFLARPRRFGKSLFLSALRYFFEGKRELFKGLYIDSTDWKWEEYPVLRLDLNTDRYAEQGKVDVAMDYLFGQWERKYEITDAPKDLSKRFQNIIESAHRKTGKQVVILVDEYDKPLVGNLNSDENFEHYRAKLASLYSNFKSSAEHIRMVFLTGVSRFSKLSVFSDLNNLNDLTFDDNFADVCGITEQELKDYFNEGIEKLAEFMKVSYDEALSALKKNYDGYRFAGFGSDIYNPWSVLNCLDKSQIYNYWNDTGFPSLLAETLKKMDADLEQAFDVYCPAAEMQGMDLKNLNPTALLYQTGYLTIKDFYPEIGEYHLGIPNNEIKKGFFSMLVPYYVENRTRGYKPIVSDLIRGFVMGKPEDAMKALQSYFAGIDYKLKMENENNFHNAFYLLTDLIGLDTDAEVHTSDGSIDISIKTRRFIYIIELKYDHSAEDALAQIEEKKYARPYESDGRKVYLIGADFSSKTRCIESWLIKEAD